MLENLEPLPVDPILGLAALARADTRAQKVDLTVGVYMDDSGHCPVFRAVQQAQHELAQQESTKAYLPPAGDERFNAGMQQLLLGADSAALRDGRVSSIQTPGGCGALRISSEVVFSASPDARVWVSNPTWPVHIPLLGSVGLAFQSYRYYNPVDHSVDFDAMVEDLQAARPSDVVLLHGCCHNPSGADLTLEQWAVIADMAQAQGFTPMVDIAYQGLADGLEADAAGLRLLVEQLPEVIIAASCSKNMGLYRERTGAAVFVCQNTQTASRTLDQAKAAARRVYSMPPAHGALLAGRILSDATLGTLWREELAQMCQRINRTRGELRAALQQHSGVDFAFIERERGMFSFLGLSIEQAVRLREEYSLYMLESSRINVAGVNADNIDYVAQSVAAVL
ncbi:MAG: aspartate/tyrosine/aromatic aminotransferase [Gammaproteobacteria bacterium]|nr:aspartate/tyrosine/aromatic aminotransferase [Gammaproteobacteria bacterium]